MTKDEKQEFRDGKLLELAGLETQIKQLFKEMGLIPISEAAELRGSTRQALIQLANASRITKVKLLEAVIGAKAPTFCFRDEIKNFQALK